MTADVELLPCPWCVEKLASVSVSEGSTFRWRKVDGCCADGPEIRHDTMAEDQAAAEAESRTKAIAAWNARACVAHATAANDAEIEALRAEVETLRDGLDYLRQMQGVPDVLELRAKAARAERLAEALDIIARVGKASRNQTARTRWIVARAVSALNGDDDWQALSKPKGFHDALLRDRR